MIYKCHEGSEEIPTNHISMPYTETVAGHFETVAGHFDGVLLSLIFQNYSPHIASQPPARVFYNNRFMIDKKRRT